MKSTIYTLLLTIGLIVSMAAFLPARIPVAHAENACSGVPNPFGIYGLAVQGFNDGGQQGAFTIDDFYPLSAAGTFTFTPSSPDASSGTVSRHFFRTSAVLLFHRQ